MTAFSAVAVGPMEIRRQQITKKRAAERGAILFELMISLFLLAISVTAIMSASGVSSRLARQAEMRAWAMSIARKQIDTISAQRQSNRRAVDDEQFSIPADLMARFPGGTASTFVRGD